MTRHIFLAQTDAVSPRWQEAFPAAQLVYHADNIPKAMTDITLWVSTSAIAIEN